MTDVPQLVTDPGPAVATPVVAATLAGSLALLLWIEHEYLRVEASSQTVRYAVVGLEPLRAGLDSIPDVVLLDVTLPDGYGPSLLYETANQPIRPPIILITAYGDIEMAVDAMKNGAQDIELVIVALPGLRTRRNPRTRPLS